MVDQLAISKATATLASAKRIAVPAIIANAGERAQTRFWEFFVSNFRNPHMRRAYDRAVLNARELASRPFGPSSSNNKDCYF